MYARKEAETERTMRLVKYCMLTGKSLFIASLNPDFWYDRISKEVPEAKLKKHEHGVSINEK